MKQELLTIDPPRAGRPDTEGAERTARGHTDVRVVPSRNVTQNQWN